MTYEYYLLYPINHSEGDTPVGLIAGDGGVNDYVVWDHSETAWVYDPELAFRVLTDLETWNDVRRVTRKAAEQAAPIITGGEQLPDEDTIKWIFSWQGAPPQANDE